MYKLLIVDDEEIEREGMARFIPWADYGIELVGTARDGVEGFGRIQAEKPDIVLTDVKMPVMDGIELIKRTKASFPDIGFIVLSGYGEYEFTSRAMEEGVRHYILKPCDEEKIAPVLELVKQEIEDGRKRRREQRQYSANMRKLLPRAKAQIFRNVLLGREQLGEDYSLFLQETEGIRSGVILYAFRMEKEFDYLEQFVLENILEELLLEDTVLLTTAIRRDVLFLLEERVREKLPGITERICREFLRVSGKPMQAAASRPGTYEEVKELYREVQELFLVGAAEHRTGLLWAGLFRAADREGASLIPYRKLLEARSYGEILFELYLSFLKMELLRFDPGRKREICVFVLKLMYGGEDLLPRQDDGIMFEKMADAVAGRQLPKADADKEELRSRAMLKAVYGNIANPELSIQYLAREVLFMNEDHFGRVFLKNTGEKFTAFLLGTRIALAREILRSDIDIGIADLGERLGFSPDGQYFSKAFRKTTGCTPKEYRENVRPAVPEGGP